MVDHWDDDERALSGARSSSAAPVSPNAAFTNGVDLAALARSLAADEHARSVYRPPHWPLEEYRDHDFEPRATRMHQAQQVPQAPQAPQAHQAHQAPPSPKTKRGRRSPRVASDEVCVGKSARYAYT
jgi:hypothetical protein